MGWLDDIEQRLDRRFNGAFARAFKGQVEPVELSAAIRSEMDKRKAIVSPNRTVVPNSYTVELCAEDYGRLQEILDVVCADLEELAKNHAEEQRYAFVGPVTVTIVHSPEHRIGQFRVSSRSERGPVVDDAPIRPQAGQPRLDGSGRSYALPHPINVIGRGAEAHIQLEDPGVSRRHAEIILGPESIVRDLSSTNGTWVDDQRIDSAILRDGSRIMIGSTILIFRVG